MNRAGKLKHVSSVLCMFICGQHINPFLECSRFTSCSLLFYCILIFIFIPEYSYLLYFLLSACPWAKHWSPIAPHVCMLWRNVSGKRMLSTTVIYLFKSHIQNINEAWFSTSPTDDYWIYTNHKEEEQKHSRLCDTLCLRWALQLSVMKSKSVSSRSVLDEKDTQEEIWVYKVCFIYNNWSDIWLTGYPAKYGSYLWPWAI